MDISLKLKKVIAAFGAFALLVSNAGVALAQTFNDVPTSAWYYDYVEQMVDQGVFDANQDNFRPNDALNRAELVKIVITAIDGLSDYEAPATPTFDDVTSDAWYYDYVEAAVAKGIVGGYTDSKGNPTGKFGPSDTVNRAAATKILVNAFAVPEDLDPASKFADVKSADWFYNYVVTAYNQSILDGYSNGKFGPADPVTRAQVAKLAVNAQNPVERASESETPSTPTSKGALEVSLNDNTARSATVPKAATSVDLLSFDLTAASDDVTVTNIVLTRGGVGNASDWDSVYLYDGVTRLTTGRTISNDTNIATFPVNLKVEAGTTKTLRVVADMNANGTANNQHYFYIASAADVTSNAKSSTGDFPVTGNTFTTGGVTVNTVTLTSGSIPAQPQVGQKDAEVSSFKLTAGATNDIALHQITVTQNGALSASKLKNLKLLRDTDVVAEVDGFTGDRATFVLSTPYVIQKGQNRTFYIHADIDGGRPTDDSIRLYLDENSDIIAIDQQYGYGAIVTNTSFKSDTAALLLVLKGGKVTIADNGPSARQVAQNTTNVAIFDYSITADRDLLVKDMDLTVRAGIGGNYTDVPDATATTTTLVAAGNLRTGFGTTGTDMCGGTAATCVGQVFSVTIGGTAYYCTITGDATNLTNAGTNTTTDCPSVTTGTETVTVGVDPYQYIENVRITDIDSGATLQGPVTRWNATTTKSGTTETTYSKKLSEDYELTGGETRHLRVAVDFNQNMPSGLEVDAMINYVTTTGYIKDQNANKDVATTDIVGGNSTSKKATVKQNSLVVSKTSNVITQQYVKGSDAVDSLQIAMQAGDAGDIKIKKLTFRVYADDTAGCQTFGTASGDIEGKTYVSSVSLYDGNTLVAGPKSLELVGGSTFTANSSSSYDKALFDNLSLIVPKGQTKNLTAKVKLLNNFSGTKCVSVDMVPGSDVLAEDPDANTVTATSSTANLNGTTTPNPVVTIITNGTLSATSTTGSLTGAEVYSGGTNDVLVSQYSFTAEKEGYNVNKITIINDLSTPRDTAADTNVLGTIKVTYLDVNGVEQSRTGSLSSGSVTLSNLGFYVPKDTSRTLKIYASTAAVTSGTFTLSGKKFSLAILEGTTNTSSTFEAVGASSSEVTYFNAAVGTDLKNSSNIPTHVVRKSKPVFTHLPPASSPSQMGSTNNLYQFTVKAEGGDVSLARLVFDITTSGLTTGSEDIYNFKFQKGTSLSSLSDVTGANIRSGGTTPTNLLNAANGAGLQVVEAGSGVNNGTYKVTVTFDNEETISSGTTQTYVLKADQSGADTNDTITTKIATGDETTEVSAITAAFDNDNGVGNTAEMSSATVNQGLFLDTAAASSFLGAATFTGIYTARNVIWSDQSGGEPSGGTAVSAVHTYPTVATGVVTAASGTGDWTNGYLLNVDTLNGTSFKQ